MNISVIRQQECAQFLSELTVRFESVRSGLPVVPDVHKLLNAIRVNVRKNISLLGAESGGWRRRRGGEGVATRAL